MRFVIALIGSVILSLGSGHAAELTWVRGLGGSGGETPFGIAVDGNGNVVSVGTFAGTVDFDPGIGVAELTSNGASAVYVSKLDPNGDFVWARKIDGNNTPSVSDVAVDTAGAVYLAGRFPATTDFDPGPGTFELTSAGVNDAYLAKLDANGDFVWAVSWGGSSNESAESVAVADNGNIYVGGNFLGTVDFDPGAGTTSLTSGGSVDAFVSKFDSSGVFAWAVRFGTTGVDLTTRVATDADGDVVAVGNFQGTVDFDPGAGVVDLTGFGDADVFVVKLESNATLVWARKLGGFSTDFSQGLVVDAADGVHVVGYFAGTSDFDPGPATANLTSAGSADAFVVQLNSSGDYEWAERVGGSGFDLGLSIAVLSDGRVFAGGEFEGTVDFDPGPGMDSRTAPGIQSDPYLIEFDGLGGYIETYIFSGGGTENVSDLDVDAAGQVYATGRFTSSPDFDPGPGFTFVASNGSTDSYVARYGAAGAVMPDIVEVEIGTTAAREAGSATTVYAFDAFVLGDINLLDVTLTPPGRPAIPLAFDAFEGAFVVELGGYASLAGLRADFPLGDYRLEFNGASSFVDLGYPDLTPQCFADIAFPAASCVVSPTPTFVWSLPAGCSAGAVDVGLDVAGNEDPLFELSFIPGAGGSFVYPAGPITPTPLAPPPPLGPLTVGELYTLGVDVVEGSFGTEFVNGDDFEYFASFRHDRDASFTVSPAGPVVDVVLDGNDILWSCAPSAAIGFDVIRGDLQTLLATGFGAATTTCVVNDHVGAGFPLATNPPAGSAWWYLVREVTVSGNGSYSSGGAGQLGDRDTDIAASGADCS